VDAYLAKHPEHRLKERYEEATLESRI